MNVHKDLYYTEDHEWLRVEDDGAFIGLSDHAQESLGDIVYVELPDEDEEIDKGEEFAAVESVKAASDVYMPVSGVIVELNEELMDEPGMINEDPYNAWLVKIEMTDESELDELMNASEYEAYLEEEA